MIGEKKGCDWLEKKRCDWLEKKKGVIDWRKEGWRKKKKVSLVGEKKGCDWLEKRKGVID